MRPKSFKIANRYAKALLALAEERRVLADTAKDTGEIFSLLEQSPELKEFILNPVIPPSHQQRALKELFERRVHALTFSFLLFLVEQGRLRFLAEISQEFEKLYREHRGILKAKVVSAVPLTAAQIEVLAGKLKRHFAKEVELETATDQSLLGGLKIHMEDLIYDLTLQRQFGRFRHQVMTA